MAQVKVYGIRGHLDRVRTKLSETIHDCVVEALRFPRDKRAREIQEYQDEQAEFDAEIGVLDLGVSPTAQRE